MSNDAVDKRRIKTRRKHTPGAGLSNMLFASIYELIRSFIKPKVVLNLAIDSTPELYSAANTSSIDFREGQYYFSLSIKSRRKEIGNFKLSCIGYFYDEQAKTITPMPLIFESLPEVIEAEEEILLKNISKIDFQTIARAESKIRIELSYEYQFISTIKINTDVSNWSFQLDGDRLISNNLQRI